MEIGDTVYYWMIDDESGVWEYRLRSGKLISQDKDGCAIDVGGLWGSNLITKNKYFSNKIEALEDLVEQRKRCINRSFTFKG